MAKTCQICGKPSGVYPLCPIHFKQKAEGKIVKCPDCEKWHMADSPCSCKPAKYTALPTEGFEKCVVCGTATTGFAFCKTCWKKYTEEEKLSILNGESTPVAEEPEKPSSDSSNSIVVVSEGGHSKCITCGKATDGLLFCPACYHKYKNKELLFRITGCTNVELLDEDYEGRYTCKDGHIVKSKSERDIDNYLFEHGIPHAYERELPYGATDREVLHPDFYLPHYLGEGKHVYIEHWGYNENNIQYTKTKKFKLPIYEKLGITLICTYEKTDMGKIDTVLDRKLNKAFIKENSINFEESD